MRAAHQRAADQGDLAVRLDQVLADRDRLDAALKTQARAHQDAAWRWREDRARLEQEIASRDHAIGALQQQLDDALGYGPAESAALDAGAGWQARREDTAPGSTL